MKLTSSTIKENLLAILIALVLSFSIVFLISRVDFLKADITGAKNLKSQLLLSDFIVKKQSTWINIISNRDFDSIQNIMIDISYDPSKTKITDDNIDEGNVSITNIDTGQAEILIQWVNSLKKWDTVLKIKWVDGRYVNISNITLSFTDWSVVQNFQIFTKQF